MSLNNEETNKTVMENIKRTKIEGTVKWFNRQYGYGFIKRDDTNEELFVHLSALYRSRKYPFKRVFIRKGDRVRFSVVQTDKGNEAHYVRRIKSQVLITEVENVEQKVEDNSNNTANTVKTNALNKSEFVLLNFVKEISKPGKNDIKEHKFQALDLHTKPTKYLYKLLEDMFFNDGVRVLALSLEENKTMKNKIKIYTRVLTNSSKDETCQNVETVCDIDNGNDDHTSKQKMNKSFKKFNKLQKCC